MGWLIIAGAILTLLGLAGIVLSAFRAIGARRAGLEEAALKQRLRAIMVLNMLALLVSVIGLMSVSLGIFLG